MEKKWEFKCWALMVVLSTSGATRLILDYQTMKHKHFRFTEINDYMSAPFPNPAQREGTSPYLSLLRLSTCAILHFERTPTTRPRSSTCYYLGAVKFTHGAHSSCDAADVCSESCF